MLAAIISEADGAVQHLHGFGHSGFVDFVPEFHRQPHGHIHFYLFSEVVGDLQDPLQKYFRQTALVVFNMQGLYNLGAVLQQFLVQLDTSDNIQAADKAHKTDFPA